MGKLYVKNAIQKQMIMGRAKEMDKGNDGRGIYRAIYTSLWDDPDFRKLSPETKLVFLNIRTSPLTNIPCIYNFYFEAIEKQTGLNRKTIKFSLDTLCHTLFIEIEDGIVWVRKGLKFDPNIFLSNPKHQTAVKKIILSLPKLKIVKNFIEFYKLDVSYEIPYAIPYANQEPNPKPNPKPNPEKEKDLLEQHEIFWKTYPKKKAKGDSEKVWTKLKPSKELQEKIINKVQELKMTEDWLKESGKYIPFPATWLNRKGWEDETTLTEKKDIYANIRKQ